MNNSNDTGNGRNGEMDDVGRLIRHAGAREAVPADRLERSRDKVRDHWKNVVREQQAPREKPRFLTLARAAAIMAAVAVAMVLVGRGLTPNPQVSQFAIVERVAGEISVNGQSVSQGQEIAPGSLVNTKETGRLALRLSSGQGLRLDHSTQLTFETPHQLTLGSGAIYIDTDGADQAGPIDVVTTLGTARDIGTRFQVRLSSGALLVGVRDGLVQVEQGNEDLFEVSAGYQARFAAMGQSTTEPLDTDDPGWDWIEDIAPAFDMDGASLAEFLDWYTRETGVELIWADAGSQRRATRITLTGDLGQSSPGESFTAVQRVAPFEYRREEDRLWVRVE